MRHERQSGTRVSRSIGSNDTAAGLCRRLFTINEAGAYLALGPWRVRSLIWAGELAFIKLGRRILIDRKDLDALLDSKKQKHGTR
jgi:excisionase family DNA binding protein